MYTSLLAVALAPVLAGQNAPAWLNSYSAGTEAGQKVRKPVAVFVGSGSQGHAALVKEGHFSAEALGLLSRNYVCVYLDRSKPANQQLVRDLSIGQAGLVISDRSGDYQAFHHDGAISQADLTVRLQQFGNPDLVISNTVSNAVSRVSYYGDPGAARSPAGFSTQRFIPSRSVNC